MADILLTVEGNQQTLYRQIGCQFQGKRRIPNAATDHGKKHGRDTVWQLHAQEEPEHINGMLALEGVAPQPNTA